MYKYFEIGVKSPHIAFKETHILIGNDSHTSFHDDRHNTRLSLFLLALEHLTLAKLTMNVVTVFFLVQIMVLKKPWF